MPVGFRGWLPLPKSGRIYYYAAGDRALVGITFADDCAVLDFTDASMKLLRTEGYG